MLHLRGALLGLALLALTASSQTTPPAPTSPPPGTAPSAKAPLPTPTPAVSPTAVAATVNGEAIYEFAVQRALEHVPPARRAEMRPQLINNLVDDLIIDQSLRAAGYKVEPSEVEKRVADMKAELKKLGKDFGKMLGDLKVTEAEVRTHIGADLRWIKYASTQATDKALQELFTTNKDMFDRSAVRALHILLTPAGKDEKSVEASKAQVRQLKAQIEAEVSAAMAKLPAGTDKLAQEQARGKVLVEAFAKCAKEKSECPTKSNGGDVGMFRKIGFMVEAFSQAAFALQVNQMSEPVVTPFGCHLILVTERKAGDDVKFDEVKEVVREVFYARLRERLAATLRPKASVVVNAAPK